MGGIRRFWLLLFLPVAAVIIGTAGFMATEGLSFLDALYLTVSTIGTVGYGDIHPVTNSGKIFAIFIIVFGISAFLTVIGNGMQLLLQRGETVRRRHRLSMLIGVFFTEVGNELLRMFCRLDPNINNVRKDFLVTQDWKPDKFTELRGYLEKYEHAIDPALLELEALNRFLQLKGDMLIRELENSDILENESFTELLWAVVHLRDELVARLSFANLPPTDMAHLAVDAKRVYKLLTREWTDYMLYLKDRYPFLFSLALRTNPFVENPSAIVMQ